LVLLGNPSNHSPNGHPKLPLSDEFDYSDDKPLLNDDIIDVIDDFDGDIVGEHVGCWDDHLPGEPEDKTKELTLTSENISVLRAAIFLAKEAQKGKSPLHCNGSSEATKPRKSRTNTPLGSQ